VISQILSIFEYSQFTKTNARSEIWESDISGSPNLPMHYGAIVGDEQDAITFKKALEGKVEVLVLKKQQKSFFE